MKTSGNQEEPKTRSDEQSLTQLGDFLLLSEEMPFPKARSAIDTPLRRGMAHLPIPPIARTIRAVKQNY